MGCCCSGKKAVLRPSSDAGPMVGGCYSLRKRVPLMKSPSKSSETQDTLKKQAKVLVLNLEESTGFCLVLPEPPQKAGWLAKPLPVSLRRLKGSRDVPGRYRVLQATALRATSSEGSQESAQVHANQEVVLFELGLSNNVVTGRVKTCDEESSQTGWLNLQISGSPVLDAVNLLGPEVANQPPSNGFKTAAWQVGRQYRALETQALAEQPASTSSSATCCRCGAGKMALRGSLVQLQQLQDADEGLWMQVCVQDGPNAGQIGWIQSKTDRLLVDSREQWEVERHAKPKEAMSPSGTIVKMADAKKSDALAAYEIPDQTDEPIEEIDRQDDADASKRQLSCGYCVCRLVPAERNHPATIHHHHSAMELPESPPHRRQEKLSSAELERWLQSIYLRYNPSLLPQVPEFIEKHKDTESLLVESVCRKYRVSPPSGWYKTS